MSSPDLCDISIRQAAVSDASLLESLARRIWVPHYEPIIGKKQVDYMLDKFQSENAIRQDIENGYIYDIAFSGNVPCGYCAVRQDGPVHFLSKLYISESMRGRGIARMLVILAGARARQTGAKTLRLTCNKNNSGSLAAYAHMGFIIAGECVTPIGSGFVMNDYVLEKSV